MPDLVIGSGFTFRIGPFLDDADAKTPITDLSILQADIRLSKDGGDFAQVNHAQGGVALVHDEDGWYILNLDSTDTNVVRNLEIAIHISGALPWWEENEMFDPWTPHTHRTLVF